MLKNKIKTKSILLFLISFISINIIYFPLITNATIPELEKQTTTIGETARNLGYPTNRFLLEVSIAKIIRNILSFLGVIFLILIIVGGYQWMTAGGNEETIAKAKKRIINSVIGLAIVLMAYLITQLIFFNLAAAPRPN